MTPSRMSDHVASMVELAGRLSTPPTTPPTVAARDRGWGAPKLLTTLLREFGLTPLTEASAVPTKMTVRSPTVMRTPMIRVICSPPGCLVRRTNIHARDMPILDLARLPSARGAFVRIGTGDQLPVILITAPAVRARIAASSPRLQSSTYARSFCTQSSNRPPPR